MNVLVVLGHPRLDSYVGALAAAYARGAREAGMSVRELAVAELDFDLQVRADSPEDQTLEADLVAAREALHWADHLVFVYPTWWGTMPALLKGFLDRLVLPGDAFSFYGPGAMDWEMLWRGKSGQVLTTMDTPPAVYRLIYRAPGHHAMKQATLGFCGVKPVRTWARGPIRTSDAAKRARWLEQAHALGAGLATGVRSRPGRVMHRIGAWLRALRLQFYPMAWAAYTVGALAAAPRGLGWAAYLWGYLALFALEAATVLSNEYVDYASDARNAHYGPFTGGSRVLVDGAIGATALMRGGALALAVAAIAALVAISNAPSAGSPLAWFAIAAVLTLGYTMPPLALCYRGLGEIDVAVTHSLLVLMLGYVLQGGSSLDATPWLLSLPLALAILPAIVLAGVPDRAADVATGKRTLAVRLGHRGALALAAAATIAAALIGAAFDGAHTLSGVFDGLALPAIAHAGVALALLYRLAGRLDTPDRMPRRIDLVLFVTLNYMLWFVAIPFYWLR